MSMILKFVINVVSHSGGKAWYYFSICIYAQPKIVEALLRYELVQVSCDASNVLAVTNDREIFSWGRGDNGKWASFFSCRQSLSVSWFMSAVSVGELGILTECSAFCPLMFPICSPLWQVAWGWAPRTPTTLPSRCVCQGSLRPTGCCLEWIAPWLSAPRTAFWPVAATGKVTFFYRLLTT